MIFFRDDNRMHVRIPLAVAADYDVAPQSTIRADKNRGARVRTKIYLCY